MSSTLIIARREFRSNFDSPVGYVVIILSLWVVGAFFFRDYWTLNRATMAPLFSWVPWALALLIIPSVTMRLFAEEKRTGTIELLITMPVRDREVVLGKFFATLGLIVVLLLLTLTYPVLLGRLSGEGIFGGLDKGPIFAGYFGMLLYASAGIAIGLFFSSITENQIVAFMLTFVSLAVLQTIDYLGAAAGGFIGDTFAFISFSRRVATFGRGLIDFRNVVYFLSVTTFFLILTIRSLESRKWK